MRVRVERREFMPCRGFVRVPDSLPFPPEYLFANKSSCTGEVEGESAHSSSSNHFILWLVCGVMLGGMITHVQSTVKSWLAQRKERVDQQRREREGGQYQLLPTTVVTGFE